MFKKKCTQCREKLNNKYDFCPFCGSNLKSEYDKQDYGFLGKNDFIDEKMPFLNLKGSFLNKIFNSAIKELPTMIKMIEKQMQSSFNEANKRNQNQPPNQIPNNLNVQLFVNGEKIGQNNQGVESKPNMPKIHNQFSKEKLEKFAKLPKKEPTSKIRRLSGKVVYELSVPGVNDIGNVLINQLENSIEIKAASKNKCYSKTLNINLPLLRYGLSEGNLILELQAK